MASLKNDRTSGEDDTTLLRLVIQILSRQEPCERLEGEEGEESAEGQDDVQPRRPVFGELAAEASSECYPVVADELRAIDDLEDHVGDSTPEGLADLQAPRSAQIST